MSFKDKMHKPIVITGVLAASLITMGATVSVASATTPTPTPSVTSPVPQPLPRDCTQARPITFAPTHNPGAPDQGLPSQPGVPDQGLPSDSASPSHPVAHPTPTVNPLRCSPEQFVAQITTVGNVVTQNRVIASGPVAGTGSDELSSSTNTFDRFRLPGLLRRVNVNHTGISFPSINLPLCVASVNQLGVWRFNGGPAGSVFRNSIGNGRFLLTGQWVFPTIRGVCSLSLIRGNPLLQNRINPRYSNIQVWATGLARR